MSKSPQAFRTIREVADWLGVAAHVLRFWESKFPQIKPVKRAGGRRYYRPSDMELVGGIKVLLHDQGLTIRGVQKLIRTEGVAHVAALSPPLGISDDAAEADALAAALDEDRAGARARRDAIEDAEIVAQPRETAAPEPEAGPAPEPAMEEPEPEPSAEAESEPEAAAAPPPESAPISEPVSEPETAGPESPPAEPELPMGPAAATPPVAPASDPVADLATMAEAARRLPPRRRRALRPALDRLQALHDRMSRAAGR